MLVGRGLLAIDGALIAAGAGGIRPSGHFLRPGGTYKGKRYCTVPNSPRPWGMTHARPPHLKPAYELAEITLDLNVPAASRPDVCVRR